MSIRLCVLGSSSSGNCTFVGAGNTGILIDAGFSARMTLARLAEIGVDSACIQAVCLSHEHRDHTVGVPVLHRRHHIPIYANRGTAEGLRASMEEARDVECRVFSTGSDFTIGELTLHPFAVPHDAYEPVGFVIRHGEERVAVVTDLGMVTTLVREHLRTCCAVVLEANHDVDLLRLSPRPWSLKQRILGRQGHLSNQHTAELLQSIASPRLRQVFLAHLSSECNDPDKALRETREALSDPAHQHVRISPTYPDRPGEIWTSIGTEGEHIP
jgi:phosphoribosyl 1,2-cyclic phosphodiesterase